MLYRLFAVFVLCLSAAGFLAACGDTDPEPTPDPAPCSSSSTGAGEQDAGEPCSYDVPAGGRCSRDCDCHGKACATEGICAAPVKEPPPNS